MSFTRTLFLIRLLRSFVDELPREGVVWLSVGLWSVVFFLFLLYLSAAQGAI